MIVVTAPTSKIGREVLDVLLTHDTPVRVIARDPVNLPEHVRASVEVVPGSHADAAVVQQAFEGADAVFWLVPPNPKAASVLESYIGFTRPAAEAMRACCVKRVVDITALGRNTSLADKAGYVTGSLAMDDLIASTGVHFRALTLPSFMDNLLMQASAIKSQGAFFSPIDGNLKLPSCATRDIGAVAARWLLDAQWEGQEEVAVLGPEDISFNYMAATLSEVLGKPVRFEQIPFKAYNENFLRFGFSEAMAHGMTEMAEAKNLGLDLGITRNAENTTSTSFHDWCELVLRPALAA